MRLATAGNVMVPAILLLEERGYVVTVDRVGTDERWVARRGDTELLGEDPINLLGLASLAEARGDRWRATDDQIAAVLARFRMAAQ
jgi:hypothetical protein